MRRHKHEEHTNHEAWAIPYADLMTLLLAFFVVMYAVSVVNEGKFRVMSESLVEAFNGSSHVIAPLSPKQAHPHNIKPPIAAPSGNPGAAIVPIAIPIPPHPRPTQGDGHETGRKGHGGNAKGDLGQIENQVRKALQPLIDRKLVVVRHNPDWLEIEIRTDILFPSGVAQLSSPADQVLRDLSRILAPFTNPLRVEGFTDDVPINTSVFPSNWELSAARAASVARLFAGNGVAPDRLGIIGWGEVRPIADNATIDGRNQNRRVLVVVMSNRGEAPRETSDAAHVGQLAASDRAGDPATAALPTVHVTARAPLKRTVAPPKVVAEAPVAMAPAATGAASPSAPAAGILPARSTRPGPGK